MRHLKRVNYIFSHKMYTSRRPLNRLVEMLTKEQSSEPFLKNKIIYFPIKRRLHEDPRIDRAKHYGKNYSSNF